jgi:hypothetical protein
MTLHDTIKSDAITVFCNADDFAEPVTYYKRDGQARQIDVVIDRLALAVLTEAGGDAVIPNFEIQVANDCVLGITSEELNLGGDSIEFQMRVGGVKLKRSITKLLGHDEGMLILECR